MHDRRGQARIASGGCRVVFASFCGSRLRRDRCSLGSARRLGRLGTDPGPTPRRAQHPDGRRSRRLRRRAHAARSRGGDAQVDNPVVTRPGAMGLRVPVLIPANALVAKACTSAPPGPTRVLLKLRRGVLASFTQKRASVDPPAVERGPRASGHAAGAAAAVSCARAPLHHHRCTREAASCATSGVGASDQRPHR